MAPMLHRCGLAGALFFLLLGCDQRSSHTDGGPLNADGATPPSCMPPAATACATDLGSALPVDTMLNTTGADDSHSGASCGMGRGGDGVSDLTFQWTAPRKGRYDISTEAAFDTLLTVHTGACGGEEIACNDDVSGSRQARLTIALEACETVFVVVDGFGASDVGAVRLRVSGRESVCDDGIDDDGDGLVDCDDADDCRIRACVEDGDWPAPWSDFEWEVLARTNEARAAGADCGGELFGPAGPLEMDEVIRVAARLHSQDMGAQDYFEHDSLDGRSFADRMREAGFGGPSPWGENIAAGQRTAADVVNGWMNSPGHCRNIMNPSYNVIGIGYAEDDSSSFGTYWTQDFAAGH